MPIENKYFEFTFSGSCRPNSPEDNTLILMAHRIEDAIKRWEYLRDKGSLTQNYMSDIRQVREIWYVKEVDENYNP